ncbi:MAG: hypothetical protein WHT29_11140 [Bacteroidales bacterium]|nr:hypothetical protein [Bacteroidales bacterium]HPO65370.1 hypothetical protein [Bacteroidales bacterium]
MIQKFIHTTKYFVFCLIISVSLCLNPGEVYAQGSGGPQALPNAFAGGPPPPPGGGGGGGNPIQDVPLDSDALFVLVIAGLVYLIFHHRKKWLIQKNISTDHGQ